MEIKLIKNGNKGAAEAFDNGKKAGEMTFSIANDSFIIIDHTDVDPKFKGQGVGKKLLDKVVEWAREENIKIMPLCPFANAMFQKNKDIQDVLK